MWQFISAVSSCAKQCWNRLHMLASTRAWWVLLDDMDLEIVWSLHHGAAQTEAKGELLSVSVTYEQIRATLKILKAMVYWQQLITRRSLRFVTLGPSAQQHFDVKSLSVVVVGRWDMSEKTRVTTTISHSSWIVMCGKRSSLAFQTSYLIESNQVGQEEFEHISKQSAQRVVLQAVSLYMNKVSQSQQVQYQVSNTITLTKLQ